MTVQGLKNCWESKRTDSQAEIKWWDSRAKSFALEELPSDENSLPMRIISGNNMISQGQEALDIGCGGGRFSFALERMGARVTGLDFSPRMIEECEKARGLYDSSVSFSVCDWYNVDLKEFGWKNRFDLVLANMTPAVASADTFLKLCEASKKWCLMTKPVMRKNEVLDKLTAFLGLETDMSQLSETLSYALELLWMKGIEPKIDYEEQFWENTWETEEAIKEYMLRLSAFHTLSEKQKSLIEEFLRSVNADGTVKETTRTTIAAVYWQV